MNLVDTCGWLEYFADETNAEFFAPVLEGEESQLLVPTLCIYEVFKIVLGKFGREQAVQKVAAMRRGTVVALDEAIAVQAAIISDQLKLSMADSVILATARAQNALLWTQDAHFEGVDGVRYRPKVYD